ncbi:uncharacterized protein LOC110933327 [Helianthus annuus]|uniref:uncharacterized protein LOC110933327 n=1 Tax=Helianthus annuus TaxID=4232 RepID=UPI000B8FB5F9|nr:uncharacterized protein LOC110933327 [Helianthus annuus]
MDKWPLLFALEKEKCCLVMDRVPKSGSDGQWKWCWSRPMLNQEEVAELSDCLSFLNGVSISDVKDKWLWSPDGSGRFSTLSFRSLFSFASESGQRYSIWKGGWIKSKCDIFIWRASQDRIPTRQALPRRNILIDSSDCILCGEDIETVDHLFSACRIAVEVWEKISAWLKIPPLFAFSFGDIISIHESVGENRRAKDIIRGLLMIACWCIWKSRNDKFFSSGKGCGAEIFGEVKAIGFLWLKCRSINKGLVWSEWCKYSLYML